MSLFQPGVGEHQQLKATHFRTAIMFGGPLNLTSDGGPAWDTFDDGAWDEQYEILKKFVKTMDDFVKTQEDDYVEILFVSGIVIEDFFSKMLQKDTMFAIKRFFEDTGV